MSLCVVTACPRSQESLINKIKKSMLQLTDFGKMQYLMAFKLCFSSSQGTCPSLHFTTDMWLFVILSHRSLGQELHCSLIVVQLHHLLIMSLYPLYFSVHIYKSCTNTFSPFLLSSPFSCLYPTPP